MIIIVVVITFQPPHTHSHLGRYDQCHHYGGNCYHFDQSMIRSMMIKGVEP